MADENRPSYLHLEVNRGAPYGRVIEAEQDFHGILRGVAQEVAGRDPFVWLLDTVRETSHLRFRVTPDLSARDATPGLAESIVDAVSHGIESLAVSPEPPQHFSQQSLLLVQHLAGMRHELGHVAIMNGAHGATVNDGLVANLSRALAPCFSEYGSLEGTLEGVNIHHTSRYFRIYDVLTQRGVRCNYGTRIELDDIRKGVGRRVAVTGEIDYDSTGSPTLARADDLYVFPDDDDLPEFATLRGILR